MDHSFLFTLTAIVTVMLIVTASGIVNDFPPAPGSGGANCTWNADCGIPAADCDSLREACVSLTGHCNNTTPGKPGKCECAANIFGCSNCAGQSILVRNETDPSQYYYSMDREMLDGSRRTINLCAFGRGGDNCTRDAECGGLHGLCIGGNCVCYQGYVCGNCTISETDMLYGLTCRFPDGGGVCKTDKECNSGQCLSGYCQCTPLVACPYCNRNISDLAKGKAVCP